MPNDLPDWTRRVQTPESIAIPALSILATEGGTLGELLPAQPGVAYVITALRLVPFGGVVAAEALRDWVMVELTDTVTLDTMAQVAASPEAPNGIANLPPGGAQFAVGAAVDYGAFSRAGSGSQTVALTGSYYALEA
jgi:hypothetical protein